MFDVKKENSNWLMSLWVDELMGNSKRMNYCNSFFNSFALQPFNSSTL